VRVETFDYALPEEQIAQAPTEERDGARLMVLPVDGGAPEHTTVARLPELLPSPALVVVNDTKVVPARLLGVKAETGGRVEIFLVERAGQRMVEGEVRDVWYALGKSSKGLKAGTRVITGPLVILIVGRSEEKGLVEVALTTVDGSSVDEAIRSTGHVPLPPYIKREDGAKDRERYQTVFARAEGAIAAPTAGLHITRAMLGRLAVRGLEVATVTLHVGLGTFQPVTVEDLDQHPMHSERYEVSRTAQGALARARESGASVVAIGTTVVRTLESVADPTRPGFIQAGAGDTRLLIQPGHRFQVVDVLLTNFHLPKSTLLARVCAFGGTERVLSAYATAVREGYRFFSYGDAMLLLRAR
jgi:S-adenosylmethionine:tRNA ribosyltransferase-isomerase